jgi:hypothetical protein
MMQRTIKIPRLKKKSFSSFSMSDAYKHLGIKTLSPWSFQIELYEPSNFFIQHLERLNRKFDLQSYEESKKLLIDAFCDEAMEGIENLKIWKGGKIESDILIGNADYLIAEKQDYIDIPFLCIVEAKRDDFEQGLAQCLVEMQACQWKNNQAAKGIDVLGVVTNASEWIFYKLATTGIVYQSRAYISDDAAQSLGALHYIFRECEKNLNLSLTM